VDDQEVTSVGHLKLKFYTSYWVGNKEDPVAELYNKSVAEEDAIFWICIENDSFEDKVKRVIAVEQALAERERRASSPQEIKELDRYHSEMEIMKNDELPDMLSSSARNGTVIYRGDEDKLSGKEEVKEIFGRYMKKLSDELFTIFHYARVRIEKDKEDIGAILRWKGGSLPLVYSVLKFVDRDGRISISAPVAHMILSEVKSRTEKGIECTGLTLVDHFGAPPYGWDSAVVRLALATLFKNGSLQVESEGRTYISPDERGSHELFTHVRDFRKSRFLLGATVSREQKDEARRLMSEILGRGVGVTPEEISKELDDVADGLLESINGLKTTPGFYQMPYLDVMNAFEDALKRIKEQPSYPLKVLTFIDEGTIQPIKDGVPVLSKLKEFVGSGKLEVYLSVRRFVDRRLSELLKLKNGDLHEKSDAISKKISSPVLLDEWGHVYEVFSLLKDEYVKAYKGLHIKRQQKAEKAILDLEKWGKSRKLGAKIINGTLEPLHEFLCEGGKEGKYDEHEFVCGSCGASLSVLNYNVEAVAVRYDAVKSGLVKELATTEVKPTVPERWSSGEIEVRSVDDFERVVDEATEAVQYGINKKKRVNVRIEVERS